MKFLFNSYRSEKKPKRPLQKQRKSMNNKWKYTTGLIIARPVILSTIFTGWPACGAVSQGAVFQGAVFQGGVFPDGEAHPSLFFQAKPMRHLFLLQVVQKLQGQPPHRFCYA